MKLHRFPLIYSTALNGCAGTLATVVSFHLLVQYCAPSGGGTSLKSINQMAPAQPIEANRIKVKRVGK